MISSNPKEFRCIHCNGNIRIPVILPATMGPGPYCGGVVPSPANRAPLVPRFEDSYIKLPSRSDLASALAVMVCLLGSVVGSYRYVNAYPVPGSYRPISRTAIVELSCVGEAAVPELQISRFICWEFPGLGSRETPTTAPT